MSFRLFTLLMLFSTSTLASSVLLVGDSHTVGPFGRELTKQLTKNYNQVVTLGHSSSASFHWMSERTYSLSGGVFQKAFRGGKSANNPNPTHWRERVPVPKFQEVIKTPYIHSQWRDSLGEFDSPELVIIALGANDINAIASTQGYRIRGKALSDMARLVLDQGAKCVWVAPPSGKAFSSQKVNRIYQMLEGYIADKCVIISSRKYRAECSDGIHFSCSSQRLKAIQWAREVSSHVKTSFDKTDS